MREIISNIFGKRAAHDQHNERGETPNGTRGAEGEGIPEKMQKKKQRVSYHLNNIFRAQKRLESLHTEQISFTKRNLAEGGFAALQVLLGAVAFPGGMMLRDKIGHSIGAAVSYQGAQMMSRGLLKLFHGVAPVSHKRLDKRASSKEIVSEHSLREKMADIWSATHSRRNTLKEHCDTYRASQEKGFIAPEQMPAAREIFLTQYIAYLDELIDGQTDIVKENMETILGPGLVELSAITKDYYKRIARPHREQRDALGMLGAAGLLIGAEARMPSQTAVAETFWALTSGVAQYVIEALEKKQGAEAAESYMETIEHEIESLRQRRLEKALRLERLIKKRLEREKKQKEEKVQEKSERLRTAELTKEDDAELKAIFERYQEEVRRIVGSMPSDILSNQTVAATTQAGIDRGALTGFLGVTLPEQLPAPETRGEERVVHETERKRDIRDVVPPAFGELEHKHLRREVDRSIIRDIAEIAGRELNVITEDTGWLDPVPTITEMIHDTDLEDEVLDEIARYLADLDAVMTAHQSVRDFQQFHLADIVHLKQDVEKELYLRERARFRELIMRETPSGLRNAILRRSRIRDIPARETESVSQEYFEDSIREWMRKKSTREHDRNSLRKFLAACEEILTAIPHMTTKDEKEHIVRRATDVLNEFLPEVHFPDPEQHTLWSRRIEEITAAFNRIRYSDQYQVVQRVPEILQTEDFVPSQAIREVTFAKAELYDDKIKAVDSRAIVGSYLEREAWVMYDRQKIVELAQPLIDEPTPEQLHSFFVSEVQRADRVSLEENIELFRIPGPRGPMYFVLRGIQHVAAAKVAGLPRLIARVRELRPSAIDGKLRVYTKNGDRYEQWIELKEAGLIDGDLLSRNDVDIQNGRPMEAKIRFQTAPWLIWFNRITQADSEERRVVGIPEISRIYQRMYQPAEGSRDIGPLDKLKDVNGKKVDGQVLASDTEFFRLLKKHTRRRA